MAEKALLSDSTGRLLGWLQTAEEAPESPPPAQALLE